MSPVSSLSSGRGRVPEHLQVLPSIRRFRQNCATVLLRARRPANGTGHSEPFGPASLATAMLKLLRLACSRLSRVENSRNPARGGAMLISPVLFITHLWLRLTAVETTGHISTGTCRRVPASLP